MRWRWSSGLVAASILALASPAAALDFDDSGVATLDTAALATVDFEATIPTGFTAVTEGALEGKQAGRLPGFGVAALPGIALPGKRAVATSLFARGAVNAYLVVRHKEALKLTDSLVPLFATGRVTSDGWYELSSSAYSIDPATVQVAYLYAQNLGSQPADIDAVEVLDTGSYQEATSCAPPDDTKCGPGRICQAGVCREADASVPALPPAGDRAAVAAVLSSQIDLFYGGLKTRQLYLPKALAALSQMGAQTDAWSYWRQLLAAMHALHDAHTYGYVGYYPRGSTGACFIEGDGDLSKAQAPSDATYPDIVVSHALPGAGFSQGDRLVAVNGQHPIAFMHGLAGRFAGGYLGSDDASHSYAANALASAIPTYASTITVISCPGGVCAAPKTIQVATLPLNDGVIDCDNRVGFHFASGNPDASTHQLPTFVVQGQLADTTADEALYGAAFNSFTPDDASNPFTPIVEMATSKAKGIILDHRKGYGGYSSFASELSAPLRKTVLLGVTVTPQSYRYDPAFTQAKGKALFDASSDNNDVFAVGSDAPKPGLKAAVLIANSESAGDFFAFGMKGPSNIRLFGRRTQGAFSTAYYLAFGPMSWGFGSGETFEADGTAKIGQGTLPDEDVLPTQSDLTKGIDTAYARALAWLRTCTDCDGETK